MNRPKPQDDYYTYINYKWLNSTKIPEEFSSYNNFTILREKMIIILKDLILKEPNILGKFYSSGVKYKRNISQLERLISQINKLDIIDSMVLLNKYNLSSPLNIGVCVDTKSSENYTICLSQSGLGLPYRYYTLEEMDILIKYYHLIENILSKILKKKININKIFEIEIKIAKISLSPEEQMDIEKTYNPMSINELKEKYSKINWDKLLKDYNIHSKIIVESPEYLNKLQNILEGNKDDLKLYFIWNLIRGLSSYLTDDIINIFFLFYGKILQGKKKRKSIDKEVVYMIESLLSDFLCMEFKKLEMINSNDIKYVTDLSYKIKEKYNDVLNSFNWLTGETKQKALQKLKTLGIKVGYPEEYDDYSNFILPSNDNYLLNVLYINEYHFNKYKNKYNNKIKVNKKLWYMNSFEVNAAYIPSNNEIILPAAVLLEPFYSSKFEDVQNYAGIGTFIGHEIMHAFDTHGSKFDENGNFNDWWSKKDLEEYEKMSEKLVEQYNNYQLNGELTLGENFADIFGFKIAFDLCKNQNKEKFYKHYALSNRELQTQEHLKLQIATDPHAPSKWRVNGVLSNLKEFYLDYNIKENDNMYLAENKRFL